jgi:hypothetical protein
MRKTESTLMALDEAAWAVFLILGEARTGTKCFSWFRDEN